MAVPLGLSLPRQGAPAPPLWDVLVVGAGPAGSLTAERCARAGWRTLLIEEHEQPGEPVHCTGIVGEEMLSRYEVPPELIQGELHPFQVVTPGGRIHPLPRVRAWQCHRAGLDRWLAGRAEAAGASLACGWQVTEVSQGHGEVRLQVRSRGAAASSQRALRGRVLVMATGAMTNLPYQAGLQPPIRYYRTAQLGARVRGLEGAELYLGARFAQGSFAYAAGTGGGEAKLGVLSRSSPWRGLKRLVAELEERGRLQARGDRPVCRRIPMGPATRSVSGRILAVGDAAGQAKTTTGGGIYFGMRCAEVLVEALLEAWAGADFDPPRLARYEPRWRALFLDELRGGNRVRQLFEQVGDEVLEEWTALLGTPEVFRLIEERGDFDRHRPLLEGLLGLPVVRRALLGPAARELALKAWLGGLYQALGRRMGAGSREQGAG